MVVIGIFYLEDFNFLIFNNRNFEYFEIFLETSFLMIIWNVFFVLIGYFFLRILLYVFRILY